MRSLGKAVTGCLLVGTVFGLVACGSSSNSSSSASSGSSGSSSGGKTVDIYSSLPLQGASTAQTDPMVNGDQARPVAGRQQSRPVDRQVPSLDDSTAQAGNWDPARPQPNARKVAADKKAVGYIGEFNSGATEVSIPILNQAGLPQVSPANTYVGLTTNEPGRRPASRRSTTRPASAPTCAIVPRDTIQAAAAAGDDEAERLQERRAGQRQGRRTAPASPADPAPEGQNGVHRAAQPGHRQDRAELPRAGGRDQGQGADCFFFAGHYRQRRGAALKDVNAAIPKAKLYGGDGVCERASPTRRRADPGGRRSEVSSARSRRWT